jgi:chromate transporter
MTAAGWLELVLSCLGLSLLSVGGALTVAPGMERLFVERLRLLDGVRFNASIAIAQAAPGPNAVYVAVLGYQAAGLAGAAVTFAAYMLPSTAAAYLAERWAGARQRRSVVQAFKVGLSPIVIGLLLAAAWTLAAGMPGWRHVALAAAAALLAWRTRVHLLWAMGAGAALGALGWL